jgi:hypothetical protein
MANVSATISEIKCSPDGAVYNVKTWSAKISGIPSVATVKSAKLTFGYRVYYGAVNAYVNYGAYDTGTQLWKKTNINDGSDLETLNVSSYVKGNGTYSFSFYARRYSTYTGTANIIFTNPTLTVTYTMPYTKNKAPTTVTITPTSCAPG